MNPTNPQPAGPGGHVLCGTQTFGTGWVNDPAAVAAQMAVWTSRGMPIEFAKAAPHLVGAGAADDAPLFFWLAEEKLLGGRLATWNQKSVGSCVGFGFGRGAQDLLLWEVLAGEPEQYPGAEVSPEVVYAGSRVEIGGGGISGDGSIGAWAADWLIRYGVVPRGVYGQIDLTRYDESLCRKLGNSGVPTDVEAAAKLHPVRAAAMVQTESEGWAALSAGKPIPVCSDFGFTMQRDSRGFCKRSGVWNHCMAGRGKFLEPDVGRSVVIGNSWGDYLGSANATIRYVDADGTVKTIDLPPGHFAVTLATFGGMLKQRDSFALAGLTGWAKTVVDYTP